MSQLAAGPTVVRGGVAGGAVEAAVGEPAWRLIPRVAVESQRRDTGTDVTAFRIDEGIRGSLFGAIYGDRDDVDWTRWVDFGVDVGVGAGAAGGNSFASAWAGGWADIRLLPRHASYPTLHVQVRRVGNTDGFVNATEWFFALGWTTYAEGSPYNFD